MARRNPPTIQSDNLVAHLPPWLAGVLGVVSAALALMAVFGFLFFIFASAGVFQLLGEWAERAVEGEAAYGMGLWQSLGIILLQSTLNIVRSLWAARLGFFVLGAIGCAAGLAARFCARHHPRLGAIASFLVFFLAGLYFLVPGAFYLGGSSEDLLNMGALSLGQIILYQPLTALFVVLVFDLLIMGLLWELWRQSYGLALDWAVAVSPGLQSLNREISQRRQVGSRPTDDWHFYTPHLTELKRDEELLEQARWRRPEAGQADAGTDVEPEPAAPMEETAAPVPSSALEAEPSFAEVLVRPLSRSVLPAAVVIVLCAIGVRLLHPAQARMAAHTVDGTVTLTSERPEDIEPLDVVYRPKTLTIVKLTGAGGVVTISLTGPQPSHEEKWALEWDVSEHPFTRETSIAHLTPGEYDLVFRFRDGERTDLGYSYNQGGGALAQRMGLVEGLLIATGFVAAATILAAAALHGFVLVQRSRASYP